MSLAEIRGGINGVGIYPWGQPQREKFESRETTDLPIIATPLGAMTADRVRELSDVFLYYLFSKKPWFSFRRHIPWLGIELTLAESHGVETVTPHVLIFNKKNLLCSENSIELKPRPQGNFRIGLTEIFRNSERRDEIACRQVTDLYNFKDPVALVPYMRRVGGEILITKLLVVKEELLQDPDFRRKFESLLKRDSTK